MTDLPEERNPDTPHPGPRAEVDGLYFKQGLNIGLPSLCVEGDKENATPQTQVHSPDLFCFLFLYVKEKELKLPMALKKNVENIIF